MAPNLYTVSSILYGVDEARRLSPENIYELGRRGLNVLGEIDVRFNNYIIGKNRQSESMEFGYNVYEIFGHKSVIKRESLSADQIFLINKSVESYLILISDYLDHISALETLEYLIRFYRIHIYNWVDLLLCALPYHEKPAFARIVYLLPIGNTKWEFLGDVKLVGSLPRRLIIEKCTHDMQILQALCEYVPKTRTAKYEASKTVLTFTTAVLVGVVENCRTIDDELMNQILPFMELGLQRGVNLTDQKVAVLIIVGSLARRVKLDSRRFLKWIINIAEEFAKESRDLLQLSFLALINFVQEFNVNNFLGVLLDSFLLRSKDKEYREVLLSIIATCPVENLMHKLISEILLKCMIQSEAWYSDILSAIHQKFPSELVEAIQQLLEDMEVDDNRDMKLKKMFSGVLHFLDSDKWMHHHPKVFSKGLCNRFEDLYDFLAKAESRDVFKEHLEHLAKEAKACPVSFHAGLLTREDVDPRVKIETLGVFSYLCSHGDDKWSRKVFSKFGALLVLLLSDNKILRAAAMECLVKLNNLRQGSAHHNTLNDEFLGKLAKESDLILSDSRYFPTFLKSSLGSVQFTSSSNFQEWFRQFSRQQNLISFLQETCSLEEKLG
ncbi:unnamed protein product [Cochlearia groenlandica]